MLSCVYQPRAPQWVPGSLVKEEDGLGRQEMCRGEALRVMVVVGV